MKEPIISERDEQISHQTGVQRQLSVAQRENRDLRAALTAAAERERVLTFELQHRVRNMLGIIHNILRRTRENSASQDEFSEHFEGRLLAIGRYQSAAEDPAVGLEDIVRDALLAVACSDGPRCRIGGPEVRLPRKVVELMALSIHELATNSVKFGALCQDGFLDVAWSLDTASPDAMLYFAWTETGLAPIVSAPRPWGFGRQLIEEGLPYQLGAVTTFELAPGRMECSIRLTLPSFAASSTNLYPIPDSEGFLPGEDGSQP